MNDEVEVTLAVAEDAAEDEVDCEGDGADVREEHRARERHNSCEAVAPTLNAATTASPRRASEWRSITTNDDR